MLKLPFKLDRSSFAHKPRGGMGTDQALNSWTGAVLGVRAASSRRATMFQGQLNFDDVTTAEQGASGDVLFELGMLYASGRDGVVDLIAAHKWFNLAALRGRVDAVTMRREIAELMSDADIATAQREARAWMTAH